MIRWVAISVALLIGSTSYAQILQGERFEVVTSLKDRIFTVVNLQENGLLLIRELRDKDEHKFRLWEIQQLDTSFHKVWNIHVPVDPEMLFRNYDISEGRLYMLFTKDLEIKNEYHLVEVPLGGEEIQTHEISNILPMELSMFTMVGNDALFAGYVRSRPTLFLYYADEKRIKVLPGLYQKSSIISGIYPDESARAFTVLLLNKISSGPDHLNIRTYSNEGIELQSINIRVKDGLSILSGKMAFGPSGIPVIAGTYGDYLSQGIFFGKLDGENPELKYHEFSSFKHHLDYLPDNRENKVKEKIRDRKEKGRSTEIKSKFTLHEITPYESGFLISGEIFDLNYASFGSLTGLEDYARPKVYNYTFHESYISSGYSFDRLEPDEITYYQSSIAAFSHSGEMLWDNSMTIDELELPFLDQIVKVGVSGSEIITLYKNGDEIFYQVNSDSTIRDQGKLGIELMNDDDELKLDITSIGNLEYWYDGAFFAWGIQKIGSRTNPKYRRNVYFISKILLD